MKKLLLLPLVLLSLFGMSQAKKKKVIELADTASVSKNRYNDNVDNRMKGPNGEKVYIGTNGGRYYMKGTNKVYVQSAAKKKKAVN